MSNQQNLPGLDFNSLYNHPASPPSADTQSYASDTSFSIVSGAPSTYDGASNDSPQPETPSEESAPRLPSLPAPDASDLSNNTLPFRATTAYHHHTWAKTFYSRPELMIRPESIEEVQKLVLLARRCRRRVVAVGSGHSPSDLTCTSSWMVSLKNLSSVLSIEKYPTERGSDTSPTVKRYGGRALFQAGISLENLNVALKAHNLTLPNLGSIHIQSIAGAIATATHGSSLSHGLLSQGVRGLRIVLSSGRAVWCSPSEQSDLFRAALVSLGGLGIITEIEMEVAPICDIEWRQRLESLDYVLEHWNTDLWTEHEFVRCWWMPYGKRCVLWQADKTTKPRRAPKSSWYAGAFGFHSYHIMLWCAHHIPRLLPTIEWFVMGMQYGFSLGGKNSAVEEQRTGLLMDCLYSQFVNEWALPLSRGPEALTRLSAWLHRDYATANIPFSAKNLWVHAPIEVRVTDGSSKTTSPRAFLDPTAEDGPTLYLNATLYRPYHLDPPCRERYYEAFEWLMRDLGGRPHWAKNFATVTSEEIRGMYGGNLSKWLGVREEVDPQGMFVGAWHRRLILGGGSAREGAADRVVRGQGGREAEIGVGEKEAWVGHEKGVGRSEADDGKAKSNPVAPLPLEEKAVGLVGRWWTGGWDWSGEQVIRAPPRGGQGAHLVEDLKEAAAAEQQEEVDEGDGDEGLLTSLLHEASRSAGVARVA